MSSGLTPRCASTCSGSWRISGCDPRESDRPQTHPDGTYSLARVHNIHARIEGTDSTGHVVLVAHYDSVPNALGAADDGAGVAAILEITRALTSGSPPRNDVDVVLTDAEEPGHSARRRSWTREGWTRSVSVVLNLEARGTSGPAIMFETNPDNGKSSRPSRARSVRSQGRRRPDLPAPPRTTPTYRLRP